MSASGATAGDPKFEAAQGLPDVPYAYWAETLGFEGIRVDYPDDVAEAWDEALAADRPVVYEPSWMPRCCRFRRTSPSIRQSRSSALSIAGTRRHRRSSANPLRAGRGVHPASLRRGVAERPQPV
jgi:hypothetical protein